MADLPQQDIPDSENNSIQDLIGKVLPYWPLFIILMGIGSVIAFLSLRKATPIYQAAASIIIKDNDQQNAIIQQLNGSRGGKSLENEIFVLKSSPIATEVVRRLHLYAPVAIEGRVRNLSAYTFSPVVFHMQSPDSLKEAGQVYFTFNEATRTVSFNGQAYPLNQYVNTPYGVMMILPNPNYTLYHTPYPMFFSLVSVGGMAGTVSGGLKVAIANEDASVLSITYDDESPRRAENILNELVSVYNAAAINEKNKLSDNTIRFLDERLALVEQDLDSIERKRENFRATNRIVDISSQGNQYLANVSNNDQQITNLNLQLATLDQVQRYLTSREKNSEALIPALGSVSDPVLSGQLQRLYTAEAQQTQLAATTGENFPALTAVRNEINNLRPTVLENIRNQRQNLLASKGELNNVNSRFNSLLSGLPAQERALLDIDRQQQIKNTIYTFLLQKREETALAAASTVADSRLVNAAQTKGIVSPIKQNVYLQWIISAFIIGAIFVYVRENLNRNVKSKAEVEKLTVVPVIAEIANSPMKEAIVVQAGSRSLIAEQFRYLRTTLSYIGVNESHKKILFTSSISGEGKSFITTNLGATLALTGKKVVLLEMDLRKPKLSEMMGIDRATGLSDFFIGAKTADEIIKPTSVSNLFLISCGAIPPNPAELLLNGRLPELLTHLEGSYDYILIDTAPVSPVTDAYIISPMCDATLYVTRQGRSPRVLIKKLNDILRSKRLHNMSLVFNGVKQKRFGSYYGYGYTYGYGYLDEKKGKKKKKAGE